LGNSLLGGIITQNTRAERKLPGRQISGCCSKESGRKVRQIINARPTSADFLGERKPPPSLHTSFAYLRISVLGKKNNTNFVSCLIKVGADAFYASLQLCVGARDGINEVWSRGIKLINSPNWFCWCSEQRRRGCFFAAR
jgi:hypothetical protein